MLRAGGGDYIALPTQLQGQRSHSPADTGTDPEPGVATPGSNEQGGGSPWNGPNQGV